MPSPQANPQSHTIGAVDNTSAPVLAALDAVHERLGAVETLLREARSPTATMHALYALEEATVSRIRGMSEVMNMLLGRFSQRLHELAQGGDDESGLSPEALMTVMQTMSPPPPPAAPVRKGRRRKTSRGT